MKQTTIRHNGHELDVSPVVKTVRHWEFNDDKTRLYVFGEDAVYEYALSTVGDVRTATYTENSRCLDELERTDSMHFFGGGEYMKVGDKMYAMSTAWDVITASLVEAGSCPECGKETVVEYNNNGRGLTTWIHPDGPCPAWDGEHEDYELTTGTPSYIARNENTFRPSPTDDNSPFSEDGERGGKLEGELRDLVEEWRGKADGNYHEWSRIYNSCADELEEVLE